MVKKEETAEAAAVRIAAELMVDAGMCLYDSQTKCRRIFVDAGVCEKCIRSWLLRQGRKRLQASG